MKWNPTSTVYSNNAPYFGGNHYIYVFGHNKDNTPPASVPIDTINIPRYDFGKKINQILSLIFSNKVLHNACTAVNNSKSYPLNLL